MLITKFEMFGYGLIIAVIFLFAGYFWARDVEKKAHSDFSLSTGFYYVNNEGYLAPIPFVTINDFGSEIAGAGADVGIE